MSDVLMRVTAVDYETEDNEVLIQLTGRDEEGERKSLIVEDTVPYLYVEEDAPHPTDVIELMNEDWEPLDSWVTEIERGYESYDGVPLKRISTKTPKQAGRFADAYGETWESDIPFYRRASIDYDLTGHIRVPDKDRCSIGEIETDVDVSGSEEIDPRILIGDIEVIDNSGDNIEEMKEKADAPVTHVTFWDSYEDEYIHLHLDPGEEVDPGDVKSRLEGHAEAETLVEEMDRDIHLRRFETEQDLAEGLIALFENRRPDLVSGWNWVDFDWEYLLGWFENFDVNEHRLSDIGYINGYQTERKVDCVPAFDMLQAYKKMQFGGKRSWSLDYIAKEALGVGKIPDVDLQWAYANERDRLVAYNIMDVMLCVALDRGEDIHGFFYELAELSQIQVYDTFSEMRLVDGYIMSNAGPDEILPPQEEKDIPENAGGLVLNPSDGVQEWVGVEDLKSLYPSAMITWNISPETIHWYSDDPTPATQHLNVPWLPDADEADGGKFGMDNIDFDMMWTDMREEGLIPKNLKRLFPERAERKEKRNQYDTDDDLYDVWDRKQGAVKVIMNSFYGVSSNDYWRLGKHGLGDAITSAARFALWKGKDIAEDEGYTVEYGDTDSIMVSLGSSSSLKGEVITRGKELEDRVNTRMVECVEASGLQGEHPYLTGDLHGTSQHCLIYEFEKLYRRFFQAGSKKRYAGLIVWKEGKDVDGKADTVGFESQRSDSPELTEEAQPKVIGKILSGDGFEEISEYVRGLIEDIESREIPLYRVALPATINKPIHEYGNTQNIRAVRNSNETLESNWRQGDDPWVVFIDGTPPMTPDYDVLALQWGEDLPEDYTLNLDKTLERALKGPLSPILDEMDWRFTELKKGAKTQSAASDWGGDWSDNNGQEDGEDDEDSWGW